MLNISFSIILIFPALGFFILNVFIPGPNVLNTIATSMGSGRKAGISCALATGIGVILTSLVSLFGAAIIFNKFPIINQGLSIIGGLLLLYFSKRYLQKALLKNERLIAIKNIENKIAFQKALAVLISNPKMMTTYLAAISLFPVIVGTTEHILIFSFMAGIASFSGHLFFASIFSTRIACDIYMRMYRPINGIVGTCFIIYSIKLFLSLL